MTIAIAAITNPDDVIVCVSDRMISYGDAYPAEDNAILKAIALSDQWTCAWSANRVAVILPIVEEVRRRLDDQNRWDGRKAADTFAEVYSDILHREFVSQHLTRFGYKTIEQFRKEGRADLGDQFGDLCVELARFDLGASFLFFGHDHQKHGRLFQIENPGYVEDRNALKFAVTGSGHDMAMSALRWPPSVSWLLEDTVYRVIEAKFFAETATGVGKTTTVILRNREGRVSLLPRKEIEAIREIWRNEVANIPSPENAIKIIEQSKAVADVAGIR